MCRSKKHGTGRRCPGCGSYAAAAKANANRRLSREARRKVVEHLKGLGLVESAAAVQKAPPSILKEFMEGMGISTDILGDTPLPSTHSKPPSAKLLIAQAKAEQENLNGPKITPAQQALNDAENALQKAVEDENEARKALNRERARRTKIKKGIIEGTATVDELNAKLKDIEEAKAAYEKARQRTAEARDDVAAARFGTAADLDDAARDEFYASLSENDVEAIARSLNRRHSAESEAALASVGDVAISDKPRDTSIYNPGTIPVETGNGIEHVEGRLLDGGTAFYRRGYADFVIVQRRGDAYLPVATAGSKSAALATANRIPVMTGLAPLPADASDIEREAYRLRSDAMLEVAKQTAAGGMPMLDQQRKYLDSLLAENRQELTEAIGAGQARAAIYDGVKRHKKRQRELAAAQAAAEAKSKALAQGATPAQAQAAYESAYRRALGTPTRGGGVIPTFDHKIPPTSLGQEKYASLTRSGIRAWGVETADDYSVIKERAGNAAAWGFHVHGGKVQTSSIAALTEHNTGFIKKELTATERKALTTYTGGSYTAINAAITGRDPNPPAHIKTTVSQLESAFDKFKDKNPNMEPMTVMRGTRVPSGWKGTPAEYIEQAFKVGSRVELGKVTSASTRQQTAVNFTGHPPYMMVIRTRDGIPVKSISHFSGEDEVVLPPGSQLRCVKVESKGINGYPTVYLVAEDLVAEAQDKGSGPKLKIA